MRWEKIDKDQVLWAVGEALREYKEGAFLTVEVKRWKPLKTRPELGIFFLGLHYYAMHAGYKTSDLYMLRKAIEQQYSFRRMVEGILVPIPLSEANRFEEFERFLDGLFDMAANHNPSVDMRDFVLQWEQIRKERANDTCRNVAGGNPQ
jgi:hypothetical protein